MLEGTKCIPRVPQRRSGYEESIAGQVADNQELARLDAGEFLDIGGSRNDERPFAQCPHEIACYSPEIIIVPTLPNHRKLPCRGFLRHPMLWTILRILRQSSALFYI
jgi:hypothetical protein